MKLKDLIERLAREGKETSLSLDAYLEDFIPNTLLQSETLQKAFGVTDEEMEHLYEEGYTHYEKDAYPDAALLFKWLTVLNPFEVRYWMGYAATQQLLGKFEKALHSYAMAALLDYKSPYPHYQAWECYQAMNNLEEGEKALELAYQRTQGKVAYQGLKNQIERLKDGLCTPH